MTQAVPKWCVSLALAVFALRGAAVAQAQGSGDLGKLDIPHEKYTLPNGLEVILAQDRSLPLVAVSIWYHVGSGDETPGKSGYAHLFEHMLFQGSTHVGEDKHFQTLRRIGASNVNGTTNSDRTNYFEVVPSHQLEVALWLESDRMGWFLPMLTEPSLANQRDVVREERRQNYDSVPYGMERFAVAAALYPEGHPYRYLTIGLHEDLEKASLQDVRTFYQRWYVPANATLAIGGDFDLTEAKALVDKWFGSFPRSQKPFHRDVAAPVLAKKPRVTVDDPLAKLRRLQWVWHSPANYQPGDAELDVLATVLGRTGTGRLYKILVHEKQLAQSVSVSQWSKQRTGSFHVTVDLKSDADQAAVEAILEAELARVTAEPVTSREVERAVRQYAAGFAWGLERLLSRVETLQRYNHYLGDPNFVSKDLARYQAVTAEGVHRTARAFLGATKRAEIITMPTAASVGGAP